MKPSQPPRHIQSVEINLITPHPSDPFKPYTDEKLRELAASIADYGLLEPVCLRKNGNAYEVLAGKNRVNAVRLNGEHTIDAFVMDVDDDTAAMIITDSNLKHRDRLLPSERGFAYKMQLDALKRQGKRTDTESPATFGRIAQKFRSSKMVAEHNKVSQDDIKRYIRLTHLIPELLMLVDNDTLPFYAGLDLSHLDGPSQRAVFDFFFDEIHLHMDLDRSGAIKKAYKTNGAITSNDLHRMFGRGEPVERIVPLINRKMLASLLTGIELQDDEQLIHLFAEFLRDKYNATGKINVVCKTETRFV